MAFFGTEPENQTNPFFEDPPTTNSNPFFGAAPSTNSTPFFGSKPLTPVVNPFFETRDILRGGDGNDRITGTDDDEVLVGGRGDDTLRGSAGVDSMYGQTGDDRFVIVGDLQGVRKTDTEEDTDVLGEPLTNLVGQDFDEDADGGEQVIDGGAGNNTLYVYGTADLSNSDISNVETIEIRSDVKFTDEQVASATTLNGDGRSVLRIESQDGGPRNVNLGEIDLSNIGQIDVGANVTLGIDNPDDLGGAGVLTGQGAIRSNNDDSFELPEGFAVESSLKVENRDGSQATVKGDVLNTVIAGNPGGTLNNTDKDDFLVGTTGGETFVLDKGGNDVVSAREGDDVFEVSGPGTKTLIATEGTEILDLSNATGPAVLDLTNGGDVNGGASQTDGTTIQIGTAGGQSGTFQDAPDNNVMMILDVSGSMSGTRISDLKTAAGDLFDAYENLGETAVRLTAFNSAASSDLSLDGNGDLLFNGDGAWLDIDTARDIVENTRAGGGTNYDAAINEAISAHASDRGDVYIDDGRDQSFFLSDGAPNFGQGVDSQLEQDWQDFLVDNQIVSNAIGFGGLNSIEELRPIGFNGETNESTEPLLEPDSAELSQVILEQAGLDFIENVVGTSDDDELTGNTLDNRIDGSDGEDTLMGQSGDDTLIGGAGADELTGGAGGDKFVFNAGDTVSATGTTAQQVMNPSDRGAVTFGDGVDRITDANAGDEIVYDGTTFTEADLAGGGSNTLIGVDATDTGFKLQTSSEDPADADLFYRGGSFDEASGTFQMKQDNVEDYLFFAADSADFSGNEIDLAGVQDFVVMEFSATAA